MTGGAALVGLWLIYGLYVALSTALAVRYLRRQRRRCRRQAQTTGPTPAITVLVPAFNEAATIAACLDSVRDSSIRPARIIVVDDGSRDGTGELATRALAATHLGRIIVNDRNRGKARALTRALAEVETELLFCLDADTLLLPNTLERALTTLAEADLDSVACHVIVDRPRPFLAALQDVEYAAALQLDRLSQAELGIVTTVPGAGGLHRTAVVRAAGGFSPRSLAEDTDLTLAIQRRRCRVGAAVDAVVRTVPPSSLAALLRQRERWVWGNLGAMGWHLIGAEPASTKFRLLILPSVLMLNAVSPVLFMVLLVLTPWVALADAELAVALGSALMVVLATAKAVVAFRLAHRRRPAAPILLASLLIMPLLVAVAALRGLLRRLLRIGIRW